jgi:hypothetical protein
VVDRAGPGKNLEEVMLAKPMHIALEDEKSTFSG